MTGSTLRRQMAGVENWSVTMSEKPYIETHAHRKENLVRL